MPQQTLFWFWLPLFASWLLMTLEGPFVSAIINRMPDEVVMLAAQGIVVSLSVTIESPIINLLATSTALVKDRPSYLMLRKFTVHWMVLLTLVTILLAFTPVFDLIVIEILGVPDQVARWVRPGLQIMTFWSAAIAWRRFLQGVMIRFNQTRKVAWGTAIRLGSSAATATILALWTGWPGVIIGATSLMAGVLAEALFATVAVRPILKHELDPDQRVKSSPTLTYRYLLSFHLPLAATSLLILLVQPMVAFSLARLPDPTLNLAAWPVVFQFMLVARAAAFALPEVVIAKSEGEPTFRPLRRFTYMLVIGSTIFMLTMVLSPLINVYLLKIQDTVIEVAEIARAGLTLFIPLPGLAVLISWLRGLLINNGATKHVNGGMAANLVATIIVLTISVQQQLPGIESAAVALSVAAAVELIYLWWRTGETLDFPFYAFELRKRPASGL